MKILTLLCALLLSGCATFKKVENHYHCHGGSGIYILNSAQSVSGSDADDSLNGNEVKPNLTTPFK